MSLAAFLAAGLAAQTPAATPAPSGNCEPGWEAPIPGRAPTARAVGAEDLLALRDIGSEMDQPTDRVFSVSPDGKRLALLLRRADPVANAYCQAMMVIGLDGNGGAIVVDRGGDPLRFHFDNLWGKADVANGLPRTVTPVWSADSRSILFLKETRGLAQVWRAEADSGTSEAVTASPVDVANFALRPEGTLVFATRTGAAEAYKAIELEGRSGFRFDRRYTPSSRATPYPVAPLPLSYFALEAGGASARPATSAERQWLGAQGAEQTNQAPGSVWLEIADASQFPPVTVLATRSTSGTRYRCSAPACRNPTSYWPAPDRRHILFTRREGWGMEATAFYRWRPGHSPRRLFASNDVFLSCQPAGRRTVCAHEAAVQPRRIVELDPLTGRLAELYDPNPGYRSLISGKIERLRWRTRDVEAFSDLVYPVGYRSGQRYPLVVVQYTSRGFLRGGVGDDYPIQAFAARGYFVLSYHGPSRPNIEKGARGTIDRERAALKDFAGRRLLLDAMEQAITGLIDRGLVDPRRIGVTGLSDGASTVQFAGLHSDLFAAAAISSCCWEPSQDAMLGESAAELYHGIGYPALADDDRKFWSQLSWQLDPAAVRFPVLMQLAEREYLTGIQTYTVLRQAARPAAMYVFPDEDHIKFHPAHRLANYRRSLAWFDFWLKPEEEARSEDRAFTADWQELRVGR